MKGNLVASSTAGALTAAVLLVAATGGGALANAVETTTGLITGGEIKKGTVTGQDVKNGSLTTKDIQGTAAPLGSISRVVGNKKTIPAGDIGSASVNCPSGKGFVSGGYSFISAEGEIFYADTFGSRTTWSVGGDNFDSSVNAKLQAIAFCAPKNKAISARPVEGSSFRDQVAAAVAAQKAMHR